MENNYFCVNFVNKNSGKMDKKSQNIDQVNSGNKANKLNLIKKFGVWGFMIFLVKGLVWLGVFFGLGSIFV